jgi:hypothetical protein
MKAKPFTISILVLGFLLAYSLGAGMAQEPTDRDGPEGILEIEAIVTSKFSYQGVLREDGVPVTGTRDLVFQLYSDDICTTTVGSTISMPGLVVDEGLFNVELSFSHSNINGQGLWLGLQVEGTPLGCQEIMPVPYALSLRPGATIEGDRTGWDVLHVVNTADSAGSYGVYARTLSPSGRGVYGYASASSGTPYGVYARSNSSSGAGLYARGLDAGPDIILGGNADTVTGDDGRIASDPAYASSDIVLITNDTIRIDLDNDADGEDADFEIYDGDNTRIFNVDESGAVTFGGTGIAAFPRPSYDSGWVSIGAALSDTLTHNLGGDVDRYVVDMTCRETGGREVNNYRVGGDRSGVDYYGAYWNDLTTSQIVVVRLVDDVSCPQVRIRIWVYP